MARDFGCGCNQIINHDCEKVSDIKAGCCSDNFIREEFNITRTTTVPVVVYQSDTPNIARGTIVVKNLSNINSLNFQSGTINVDLAPREERVFTIANINVVQIGPTVANLSVTAALSFDIMVRAF